MIHFQKYTNPYKCYITEQRLAEFDKWFDFYTTENKTQNFINNILKQVTDGYDDPNRKKYDMMYDVGNYTGQINTTTLKPEGFGSFNYTSGMLEGDKYKGKFMAGRRQGPGILTCANMRSVPRIVVGYFFYDKVSVIKPAYHLFKNEDYYYGPVDSIMNLNGYGMYMFSNGTLYIGHFEYNEFSGLGTIIKGGFYLKIKQIPWSTRSHGQPDPMERQIP